MFLLRLLVFLALAMLLGLLLSEIILPLFNRTRPFPVIRFIFRGGRTVESEAMKSRYTLGDARIVRGAEEDVNRALEVLDLDED